MAWLRSIASNQCNIYVAKGYIEIEKTRLTGHTVSTKDKSHMTKESKKYIWIHTIFLKDSLFNKAFANNEKISNKKKRKIKIFIQMSNRYKAYTTL